MSSTTAPYLNTIPFVEAEASDTSLLDRLLAHAITPPKLEWFSLLTLLLVGLMIWASAFITFSLPTVLPAPAQLQQLPTFSYSLQWLVLVAAYVTLGIRLATVVWVGYIVLGLFLPLFASGGGLLLFIQPAVVFIPASLISLITLSTQWERSMLRLYRKPLRIAPQKRRIWMLIKALLLSFWCCFAFHFFMACGLGLFTLFQGLSLYQAKLWWLVHSWHPFMYDVLITTGLLLAFKWLRVLFSPLLYPALVFTGSPKKLPAYEELYPEAASFYTQV
jgi:hypothetical protein